MPQWDAPSSDGERQSQLRQLLLKKSIRDQDLSGLSSIGTRAASNAMPAPRQ